MSIQSLGVRLDVAGSNAQTTPCLCLWVHRPLLLIWEPAFWIAGPQSTVAPQTKQEEEGKGRKREEKSRRGGPAVDANAEMVEQVAKGEGAALVITAETFSRKGEGIPPSIVRLHDGCLHLRLAPARNRAGREGKQPRSGASFCLCCAVLCCAQQGGGGDRPPAGRKRYAPSSCSRW